MLQYKITLLLLLIALMAAPAYCQVKPDSHPLKSIAGTVTQIDSVGNIISVVTNDQQPMTFYVPSKAIITQETHDIGIMDIRATDPLTIQYYVSSPGKYTVVSIVDNKPLPAM